MGKTLLLAGLLLVQPRICTHSHRTWCSNEWGINKWIVVKVRCGCGDVHTCTLVNHKCTGRTAHRIAWKCQHVAGK